MALNPIGYTDRVVGDFLRYQYSTYPLADPRLQQRMRELLQLDQPTQSPLLKGPYLSLSRTFRAGVSVRELVREGLLHPHMENLVPYPHLFGHQEDAIRAILAGRSALVSTGTGSGKTETFLYPIISECLRLRDRNAPPGIIAVIIYPMNALAEDQLGRLRELLTGTGIPFGMYVGKTRERTADVAGIRLRAGASRQEYLAERRRASEERQGGGVYPAEERVSREEMRAAGGQPRILLTNVKQLELLLTRGKDAELFAGADLRYLVVDEAHVFSGANGAETAALLRRLRAYCGRAASETICVGTSATLVDPSGDDGPARAFAERFFGVQGDGVALVREQYQPDLWRADRIVPRGPAGAAEVLLDEALGAVEPGSEPAVARVLSDLGGGTLDGEDWRAGLYHALAGNELCYRLSEYLRTPRPLAAVSAEMTTALGRQVSEAECLAWLVLGAASRDEGRPLLRPVVHAFVRGVGGAVVTFPVEPPGPRLWLSAEQQIEEEGEAPVLRLPLTSCSTCGQHYFVHFLADFALTGEGFGGGGAVADRRFWPSMEEAQGGRRVVLVDRVVGQPDPGDEDPEDTIGTRPLFLCRVCGAGHPADLARCDGCGREGPLVRLGAIISGERHPGYLTSCLSCGATGRPRGAGYREPARPVRAVAVADIHVLAQSMVHHADRRRLLVFADSRQEAAFQAGWMRDHARRFRLRAMMAEQVGEGASVGDLVARLDQIFDRDDSLSRALLPEVWSVIRKEQAGVQHGRERRHYLRIQVLRELVTGLKQRVGLEPWGRVLVRYVGLTPDIGLVQRWAPRLGLPPERLVEGIAAFLDVERRRYHLLDREGQLFSRYWDQGSKEVQQGYLPLIRGVPKGLKLSRAAGDDARWVDQWLSTAGDTLARQVARKFGVDPEEVPGFLEELWQTLVELELLVPTTLVGTRGNALPGAHGCRQLDGDRMQLLPHRGRWRCQTCQRTQVRPTPHDRCLAWRCDGTLRWEEDDRDSYDLMALDQNFTLLRPREHSAQVPAQERERLEQLFKGESEAINTLVCTPTLEMGVDIGGLDTVLMRNVPPLPANYWQRVGRAGRRMRLAVNVTYARPITHDRQYFDQPERMLGGRVEAPRFNLRNELMIDKHVRASVLTALHQLARSDSLPAAEREEITAALGLALPPQVKTYLFDEDGRVRPQAYDLGPFDRVVRRHEARLLDHVQRAFRAAWPPSDADAVATDRLRRVVIEMAPRLEEVTRTLRRRLQWALDQMRRLDQERQDRGTLEPDEDALFRRCERLVRRLKGSDGRQWSDQEGFDESTTFGVLATEGFLPGYGLETGAIRGTLVLPPGLGGVGDIELPRPAAVALREYVPGNLVYANGQRFTLRRYHFAARDGNTAPYLFQYDREHGAVREAGVATRDAVMTLGTSGVQAVPISDADLQQRAPISDEEEYRFQLQVAIEGYELDRHGAGRMYDWGGTDLSYRRGLHLRLVNVGPATRVAEGVLGYPVSLISGNVRSPFASDRELDDFFNREEERYGRRPEWIGFFTDTAADTLCLPNCPDRETAFSVLETLRLGMTSVLEMGREDLQIIAIGRMGEPEVNGLLYDPMPGGSGLLDQALERWPEVYAAATRVAGHCPGGCQRSCADCLQSFRNMAYHRYLDRQVAAAWLAARSPDLRLAHDIPARMPAAEPHGPNVPTNAPEILLRRLLASASFPEGVWQHQISLGAPLGTTTPDVFYPGDDMMPGVCIYLDGLSNAIHGNPSTAERDRAIRDTLRSRHYEVFEIPVSHLQDRMEMVRHFYRLARQLMGQEAGRRIRDDQSWFEPPAAEA